jgi:hypothetical protein
LNANFFSHKKNLSGVKFASSLNSNDLNNLI